MTPDTITYNAALDRNDNSSATLDASNLNLAGSPYAISFAYDDANLRGTTAVKQPTVNPPPSGIITTDLPTFAWPAAAGADHYVLQVTDTVTKLIALNVSLSPALAAGYTLNASQGLIPGHDYAWTAAAISSNRQSTIVASTSFSVAALGAPVPVSPSGTMPTETPVFQWQPIMDASHTPAAHFSLKIIDASTGGTVFSVSNLKGTSFTLPANHALTPGRNYRWIVTAVSANGRSSVESSAMSFMVAPLGSPLAVVPNGPAATDMPTFQWTPVTDSSHTAPAHFTIKIYDARTGAAVFGQSNVTGTSFSLPASHALTPGHSYRWTITAVSTNGKASVQSSSMPFTIDPLQAPTPTAPAGAANQTPTFSWLPVSDAGTYYLQILSGKTVVLRISRLSASTSSYTLTKPLKGNHNYTWRIAAVSKNGKVVVFSAPVAFETS